ncbi:MAG: hypothetical protein E7334_09100 [Clostridiales bacterium]|nr:hypothetical protein [Clostridiales bacterium]
MKDENKIMNENKAAPEAKKTHTPKKPKNNADAGKRYGRRAKLIAVFVLVAVILANLGTYFLTESFGLEFDMTRNSKYTLSSTGKETAAALTKDVVIYSMYGEESKETYTYLYKLVENFAAASDRITTQFIDPVKNPTFANQFLTNGTTSIPTGSIIVSTADHTKFRVLTSYDFYNYTYDESYNVSITGYKAESSIANALLYLNSDSSPMVYFLSGHGEISTSVFGTVIGVLEQLNYTCVELDGSQLNTLVQGDTLVVNGPTRDLTSEEVADLSAFMDNGGRMIYLAEIGYELPNFEEVLSKYGIGINNDIVYETDSTKYYYNQTYVVPDEFGVHAITDQLAGQNLTALITESRSLYNTDVTTPNLTVTSLMDSSKGSFGKVDLESIATTQADGDNIGPLSLAMAAEQLHYTSGADQDPATKLVVFGSCSFISSFYSYGANGDLFIYAVNWLQDAQADTVSIVSKSLRGDSLGFTSYAQIWTVGAIVVIVIPFIVILAGVVVWLRRRHL